MFIGYYLQPNQPQVKVFFAALVWHFTGSLFCNNGSIISTDKQETPFEDNFGEDSFAAIRISEVEAPRSEIAEATPMEEVMEEEEKDTPVEAMAVPSVQSKSPCTTNRYLLLDLLIGEATTWPSKHIISYSHSILSISSCIHHCCNSVY